MLKKENKKETKIASQDQTWIQKIRAKVAARLSRHGYRYDINT